MTTALADDVTLGDFSNNYEDSTVSSNNDTVNNTTNNNATGAGEAAPVMSSIAPTVMGGGGNDSCLLPTTSGLQVSLFGYSQGTMKQDKLLMGKKAVDKYRENPDVFIVGYKTNKEFWDKLLRIGEDLTDETIKETDSGRDTRSLSERFRTTRTGVQSNRRSEDTVVN